ncbi:GNAT family N-acetyltransferase [Enterobacter sp. Ap-1006]|uniref:GNAT family N-acetyltransferase n=1 Tax=Enterobacter sp. Ap-1006 TaxID=2608345 RepID=UPI00141FF3C0|nr:GNAT family N-acetyltransferase [Enterobacter sp. Ap-1006]NIF49201.1 GNAT family N-acetyltransferase [Enterobacter sp. Ap-1006]
MIPPQATKLFSTERTDVYRLTEHFSPAMEIFLKRNRENFTPFEPLRAEDYFSEAGIRQRITLSDLDHEARKSLLLVFTLKDSAEIIGSINFTNFIYGVFQAGHLGFSLDQEYEGKGFMYEALSSAMDYVRRQYGLHRIMANHLADNQRSKNTLAKLGFVQEGFARSYLKINGKWQDHVLNAYVFPEDE